MTQKHSIKIELESELYLLLQQIKESNGIQANTEGIRFCIKKAYENLPEPQQEVEVTA